MDGEIFFFTKQTQVFFDPSQFPLRSNEGESSLIS